MALVVGGEISGGFTNFTDCRMLELLTFSICQTGT
jgi:hypothetical protein